MKNQAAERDQRRKTILLPMSMRNSKKESTPESRFPLKDFLGLQVLRSAECALRYNAAI
jgi:hypothetical protein